MQRKGFPKNTWKFCFQWERTCVDDGTFTGQTPDHQLAFTTPNALFGGFLRLVGLGSPVCVLGWVSPAPQTPVFHPSVSTKGIGHDTTPFLPCAAPSVPCLSRHPSKSKVEGPFPASRSTLVCWFPSTLSFQKHSKDQFFLRKWRHFQPSLGQSSGS